MSGLEEGAADAESAPEEDVCPSSPADGAWALSAPPSWGLPLTDARWRPGADRAGSRPHPTSSGAGMARPLPPPTGRRPPPSPQAGKLPPSSRPPAKANRDARLRGKRKTGDGGMEKSNHMTRPGLSAAGPYCKASHVFFRGKLPGKGRDHRRNRPFSPDATLRGETPPAPRWPPHFSRASPPVREFWPQFLPISHSFQLRESQDWRLLRCNIAHYEPHFYNAERR